MPLLVTNAAFQTSAPWKRDGSGIMKPRQGGGLTTVQPPTSAVSPLSPAQFAASPWSSPQMGSCADVGQADSPASGLLLSTAAGVSPSPQRTTSLSQGLSPILSQSSLKPPRMSFHSSPVAPCMAELTLPSATTAGLNWAPPPPPPPMFAEPQYFLSPPHPGFVPYTVPSAAMSLCNMPSPMPPMTMDFGGSEGEFSPLFLPVTPHHESSSVYGPAASLGSPGLSWSPLSAPQYPTYDGNPPGGSCFAPAPSTGPFYALSGYAYALPADWSNNASHWEAESASHTMQTIMSFLGRDPSPSSPLSPLSQSLATCDEEVRGVMSHLQNMPAFQSASAASLLPQMRTVPPFPTDITSGAGGLESALAQLSWLLWRLRRHHEHTHLVMSTNAMTAPPPPPPQSFAPAPQPQASATPPRWSSQGELNQIPTPSTAGGVNMRAEPLNFRPPANDTTPVPTPNADVPVGGVALPSLPPITVMEVRMAMRAFRGSRWRHDPYSARVLPDDADHDVTNALDDLKERLCAVTANVVERTSDKKISRPQNRNAAASTTPAVARSVRVKTGETPSPQAQPKHSAHPTRPAASEEDCAHAPPPPPPSRPRVLTKCVASTPQRPTRAVAEENRDNELLEAAADIPSRRPHPGGHHLVTSTRTSISTTATSFCTPVRPTVSTAGLSPLSDVVLEAENVEALLLSPILPLRRHGVRSSARGGEEEEEDAGGCGAESENSLRFECTPNHDDAQMDSAEASPSRRRERHHPQHHRGDACAVAAEVRPSSPSSVATTPSTVEAADVSFTSVVSHAFETSPHASAWQQGVAYAPEIRGVTPSALDKHATHTASPPAASPFCLAIPPPKSVQLRQRQEQHQKQLKQQQQQHVLHDGVLRDTTVCTGDNQVSERASPPRVDAAASQAQQDPKTDQDKCEMAGEYMRSVEATFAQALPLPPCEETKPCPPYTSPQAMRDYRAGCVSHGVSDGPFRPAPETPFFASAPTVVLKNMVAESWLEVLPFLFSDTERTRLARHAGRGHGRGGRFNGENRCGYGFHAFQCGPYPTHASNDMGKYGWNNGGALKPLVMLPPQYVVCVQHRCRQAVYVSAEEYVKDDVVVVDGDVGLDVGVVSGAWTRDAYNAMSSDECEALGLPTTLRRFLQERVYRHATMVEADWYMNELPILEEYTLCFLRQLHASSHAFPVCRVEQMRFLACELQADLRKVYVYFDSDKEVRFLELATFLNSIFRCRIWVHKVSATDIYFEEPGPEKDANKEDEKNAKDKDGSAP